MTKRTNRYRSAGLSSESRRTATGHRRFRGLRLRREIVVVSALALAVIVGLGSLGAAVYLAKSDHDWASVATVNGHSISREDLRGRMAVLGLLAQERVRFIAAVSGANLPAEQATALESQAQAATSLTAARESLIDDELLRQLAVRDGIATPAGPDPWVEATAYASGDMAHRLRYVRFGLPAATSSGSSSPTPAPTSSLLAPDLRWPAKQ